MSRGSSVSPVRSNSNNHRSNHVHPSVYGDSENNVQLNRIVLSRPDQEITNNPKQEKKQSHIPLFIQESNTHRNETTNVRIGKN